MSYARIGNGLYAKTRGGKSIIEQYREMRKTCPHQFRDPSGTCYRCGDRKETK